MMHSDNDSAIQCSIDALLDRTVSHMLFLESISSHAEKLKQNSHEVGGSKQLLLAYMHTTIIYISYPAFFSSFLLHLLRIINCLLKGVFR